jgi:tetratricopeptide (TPR) repeat protein
MRARVGLALALWDANLREEAVTHAEALLRLNPNDNQGVRYVLLNWLQLLGRNPEAEVLLRQYKGDGSAAWSWSGALAVFRKRGDCAAARKALARAADANGHVADYLLRRRKPPKKQPEYVTIGSAEEAADVVDACAGTWVATPGAIDWVAAVLRSPGGRATRTPK